MNRLPVMDDDAFHGLAGEIATEIASVSEADPVAVLVDFLVAFGNAVGPSPHVMVGRSAHRAREMVVIVGATAKARKGLSRSELKPVFAAADPEWQANRVKGGLSSGEGLIYQVRDPDPERDDKGVEDRRLFIVEEEFSSVLKVVNRDGSILSEVVRRAWDDGTLLTLTRKEPMKATGAHISLIGHITEAELTARLADLEVANGFANRFRFHLVQRTRLLSDGGTSLTSLDSQAVRVRDCLAAARRIGTVTRTPRAAELWAMIYEYVEQRDDPGMVGALTARGSAHMLRTSLAYALLDGCREIDVEHVSAAYAIWQHADASVRRLFAQSTGDENADRILDALRDAGPDGLDRTSLFEVFKGHIKAAALDRLVEALEQRGLATSVAQPTGGRPVKRTFLGEESESSEQSLPSLLSLISRANRRRSA